MVVIRDRTVWLVLTGLLGVYGAFAFNNWWQAREQRLFREEVLEPLHYPFFKDKGYWVGDVTELYRLGKISKGLAEADTAPLNPLVPQPIPLHGYYVRAMESGVSFENDHPPVSFKGQTWSPDNFAILIYPANPAPGKRTWLMGMARFRVREDAWTPTFSFPTDQELREHWGIID